MPFLYFNTTNMAASWVYVVLVQSVVFKIEGSERMGRLFPCLSSQHKYGGGVQRKRKKNGPRQNGPCWK